MARTHYITDPTGAVACGRETSSKSSNPSAVDCKTCLRAMESMEDEQSVSAEVDDAAPEEPTSIGEGVVLGGLEYPENAEPLTEPDRVDSDSKHNTGMVEAANRPTLVQLLEKWTGDRVDQAMMQVLLVLGREPTSEDAAPPTADESPVRMAPGGLLTVTATPAGPWPICVERREQEPTLVHVHVQHPSGRMSGKVTVGDLRDPDPKGREAICIRKLRRQGLPQGGKIGRWLARSVEVV